MSVATAAGSFNITTGAIGSTIDLTDVLPTGYTVRAVICFYSGRTESTDAIGRQTYQFGFGMATSTSSRVVCSAQSEDAQTAADCDSGGRADSIIFSITIGAAVDGLGDINSISGNDVQFIIDDVFLVNLRVSYWVIGDNAGEIGSNVAIGTYAEPASAGNVSITPGFAGQALIMAGFNSGAAPPSIGADARLWIGLAANNGGSVQQISWGGGSNNAAADMQCISHLRSGQLVAEVSSAVTTINSTALVSSWESDGCIVNHDLVIGDGLRDFPYLIIGGTARWRLSTFSTLTSTGVDIDLTGLPDTCRGGLIISHNLGESSSTTAVQDHFRCSIGAFSSTSAQTCQAILDEDATASSECSTAIGHAAVYRNISLTSTLDGEASITNITSDTVTLQMDNADPAAAFAGALMVFDAAAAGGGGLVTRKTLLGVGI